MIRKNIIFLGILICIFILIYFIFTPSGYLKYVFYNLEKGNYDVVNYLDHEDKSNIVKIYEFYKYHNDFSEPKKTIRKDNGNFYFMFTSFLYNRNFEKGNYGDMLGLYSIELKITIQNKLIIFPRIKNVIISGEQLNTPLNYKSPTIDG